MHRELEIENVTFFMAAINLVWMRNTKPFSDFRDLLNHNTSLDASVPLIVVMSAPFVRTNNFGKFHQLD